VSRSSAQILGRIAEAELTEARPALHRSVLQLRLVLALQHSDDLRHDRQDLPYHFIDILLAEQSRRLAVGGISDSRLRGLCLSQDVRQAGTNWRTTSLTSCCEAGAVAGHPTAAAAVAQPWALLGRRIQPADGRLAAILAVRLAEGCLTQSITSQSVTGGLRGVRIERRPLLGIELWVVEVCCWVSK